MAALHFRKNLNWLLAGVMAVGIIGLSACGQSSPTLDPNTSAPDTPIVASEAQSAALADLRGVVEIYAQDQWRLAKPGDNVSVGQHVRTRDLSSAALVFYDGSRAELGSQAEMVIDQLDAQTTGPRVIQLTQVSGESRHVVATSSDPASRYDVKTDAGAGSATGTIFTVVVWPKKMSQFWVEEGAINVINVNTTVVVAAGQLTIIQIGAAPAPPAFRVTGEGEVTQMGTSWRIAGQTFAVSPNTIIKGNPQIGDWVSVTGHLAANGAQTADIITLVTKDLENTFSFVGKAEAIAADQWTIAGRTIKVEAQTSIAPGLAVGDLVEVAGNVTQNGAFMATMINRASENPLGFGFTGIAEAIGSDVWTISGLQVTIGLSTTINGDFAVGDLVLVKGTILTDSTWVALTIEPATPNGRFDLTGIVESLTPWQVAGASFEVDEGTEIDEGIVVGEMVAVSGIVQADGKWLAGRITRLDPAQRLSFQFFGLVTRTRPWTVRGVALTVNDATVIKGDPKAGQMAKVKGWILPDGTWLATEIKRTGWHKGQLGCFLATAVVRSVQTDRLVLLSGQTVWLTKAELVGQPKEASIVWYERCVDGQGTLFTVSIVVIYQLAALPVDVVIIDSGNNSLPSGCKISKKGHIKCSKKKP